MRRVFLAALGTFLLGANSAPPYSIQAIRLADSPGDAVAEMVIGAPQDEKIDTVYALWLIRGGGRHTFASQYLRVDGNPPFVLASDNVYLYRNLTEHRPSATFSEADYAANLASQQRMILLAGGSMERVIPGHDALQFQKYPAAGRIANIH